MAARRKRHAPFTDAFHIHALPIGVNHTDGADKPCGALFRRDAVQLVQQLVHPLRICGVRPCIARRVDAGGPVQGIHHQAGIVRHSRQAGLLAGGLGLEIGILCKGRASLLDFL